MTGVDVPRCSRQPGADRRVRSDGIAADTGGFWVSHTAGCGHVAKTALEVEDRDDVESFDWSVYVGEALYLTTAARLVSGLRAQKGRVDSEHEHLRSRREVRLSHHIQLSLVAAVEELILFWNGGRGRSLPRFPFPRRQEVIDHRWPLYWAGHPSEVAYRSALRLDGNASRKCRYRCPTSPGRQLQHRLQSTGHFPIAIDWNEVNALECLRLSKLFDQVTRNRDPGHRVSIESLNDRFRCGQLRHLG